MWTIHSVDSLYGHTYVIRNTRSDGYLSDNGNGGGTIHFENEQEAQFVVELLNSATIH